MHLCRGGDYPRHFTLEPEREKREKSAQVPRRVIVMKSSARSILQLEKERRWRCFEQKFFYYFSWFILLKKFYSKPFTVRAFYSSRGWWCTSDRPRHSFHPRRSSADYITSRAGSSAPPNMSGLKLVCVPQ